MMRIIWITMDDDRTSASQTDRTQMRIIWIKPMDDDRTSAVVVQIGERLLGGIAYINEIELSMFGYSDRLHMNFTFDFLWYRDIGSAEEFYQNEGWRHPPRQITGPHKRISSSPKLIEHKKRKQHG